MTSLEDRMRENRNALAEITEHERAAIDSLRELKRQSDAAAQVVQVVRQAAGNGRTNAIIAGMGGGLIVGLVGPPVSRINLP